MGREDEGGGGPRSTGVPPVSEPNLKLRYKPKKSLERRKNPLLRKESAPPSLRRRPAETLGGEAWRWGDWSCSFGSGPTNTDPFLRVTLGGCAGCPTHVPGGELG